MSVSVAPRVLPQLLSQADIASSFAISPRTLEDWRLQGGGPPYYKLSNRCVRYEAAAVERWLRGTQRG